MPGGLCCVALSAECWFGLVGFGVLFNLYLRFMVAWVWLVMRLFRCGFVWWVVYCWFAFAVYLIYAGCFVVGCLLWVA